MYLNLRYFLLPSREKEVKMIISEHILVMQIPHLSQNSKPLRTFHRELMFWIAFPLRIKRGTSDVIGQNLSRDTQKSCQILFQ